MFLLLSIATVMCAFALMLMLLVVLAMVSPTVRRFIQEHFGL